MTELFNQLLEWISARDLETPPRVLSLGIPDEFQEHASRAELLADLGLDAEGLSERIGRWLHAGHHDDKQAQSAS